MKRRWFLTAVWSVLCVACEPGAGGSPVPPVKTSPPPAASPSPAKLPSPAEPPTLPPQPPQEDAEPPADRSGIERLPPPRPPLPTDPRELGKICDEHYAQVRGRWDQFKVEFASPYPNGGCCKASLQVPMRAKGGYTEVSLRGRACPQHRLYWVQIENGAMRGTVMRGEGPFHLDDRLAASEPR